MMNGNGSPTIWKIYGNIFYNPNVSPSFPWDTGDGPISSGVPKFTPNNGSIHNNTFVGIFGPFVFGILSCTAGCIAYNNLFPQNWGQYLTMQNGGSGSIDKDYSWVYGNQNYYNGSGATNDWRIMQGEVHSTQGTADPFVNSANGDFRLKTHMSPPGIILSASYNVGMYGTARTNFDRGAVEYTSIPSDKTPPAASTGVKVK